ncbi:MAG: VWA domain-containing protein [Deltaproteobacteria bacterium]|nr:VWA domain-containing protein [Deltaproteobacteria bacterium]
MRRRRASLACVAVAICAAGCGAKTGLDVPDATRNRDGAVDAGPDAERPCLEVPLDGGPIELPLDTRAELGRADVFFLVDVTGSMSEEIDTIRNRVQGQIVPGIDEAIPDVEIGVGFFADFADGEAIYGESGDVPFQLLQPMTDDVLAVQAAVDRLPLLNGADAPESQVEALYQTATGAGLPPFVDRAPGCPRGGVGYPCFRRDALPIVLLFTDERFHNGPMASEEYRPDLLLPAVPHTYEQARAALVELGVRVIGFDSGPGTARRDLQQISSDTNTFGEDGRPLYYDIGQRGQTLDTSVVAAIRTLANTVRFDVDAIAVDLPGDDIDATELVDAIRPSRAEPASGVASIDEMAFRVVVPGTRVVFLLVLRNDVVMPGPRPQIVPVRVVFRGDGRTRIAAVDVDILIPAADGSGTCGESRTR